ncbi:LPS-assembly protein LptD [Xinfangfangia pollutisoli]|uniref:LPS-assembly protein LptD n=1 Tax=Xinfangfangia pollutisoli TaxID=2865960 RepID=UPI001CD7F24E|nr:LPS assembly protein LptD [Xinfangfangia pollutisoli]
MTALCRLALLLTLALTLALPARAQAQAQDRATLVSDRLEITGDNQLVASGAVEIFYQGNRLRAARLVYDKASDRLQIEGPIILTDAGGNTTLFASAADLSADMTEGILTSARLVLNQQLQIAANRAMRIGGRYTELDQVVASSCKICENSPVPLWEIRAARVVHDQEARQLYFDQAQFRVAGLPIFYIPRLRMPDPTLDRTTGFLMPVVRTTSDLGFGLKLPYFVALGEDKDLTVTPYLTARHSRTLELRYRQAFRTGKIEVTGALTRDRLLPGEDRGFIFANGEFDLPDDFKLTFRLQAASDNAYLLDYGYSDTDMLDSRVEISRTRRNGFFSARVVSFQSLRDDEDNNTLPSLITDVTFHRRFSLWTLGGEGGFRLQTHSHLRTSNNPLDGPDPDDIADGRDVSRISARIDWRRSFILAGGIEATILGEASADAYTIGQDGIYGGDHARSHAAAGVELRWPWVKHVAETGATHVIEPVVQLIWAGQNGARIPNEDSALVEFDEGNIWSLDRFPGADAVEEGKRANIGVSWTRYDPAGWSLGMTVGRVVRDRDRDQFGVASGLNTGQSDWLAALTVDWQNGFAATGRVILDDDFALTKGELRLALNREKVALSTSAIWAVADPQENRPDPTREFAFDARWQATPALMAKMSGRYDFQTDRGTLAGMGVEYRNDCVLVDFSVSRRFTSSTSVTPTTSFGLSVDLIGFGSGKTAGPSRRCYN